MKYVFYLIVLIYIRYVLFWTLFNVYVIYKCIFMVNHCVNAHTFTFYIKKAYPKKMWNYETSLSFDVKPNTRFTESGLFFTFQFIILTTLEAESSPDTFCLRYLMTKASLSNHSLSVFCVTIEPLDRVQIKVRYSCTEATRAIKNNEFYWSNAGPK